MRKAAITGVLQPDGHLDIPRSALPNRPSRVRLTFLDEGKAEQSVLAAVGNYARELDEYEAQLASGKIRWK